MALLAELRTELPARGKRGAPRRLLQLNVQATAGENVASVIVHNLSTTGLLIEAPVKLEDGETIYVDVPEAGPTSARVVWSSDDYHGCQFVHAISTAAVSAALLQSPAHSSDAFQRTSDSYLVDYASESEVGEATDEEAPSSTLPVRTRLAAIAALCCLSWAMIFLAVWFLS